MVRRRKHTDPGTEEDYVTLENLVLERGPEGPVLYAKLTGAEGLSGSQGFQPENKEAEMVSNARACQTDLLYGATDTRNRPDGRSLKLCDFQLAVEHPADECRVAICLQQVQ